MDRDQFTQSLSFVTKALGGAHPTRLCGGLLLGIILSGVISAFAETFPHNALLVAFGGASAVFYVAVGIFIFFLPLFLRRTSMSESNRNYLELIDTVTDKAGLTKSAKRVYWTQLLDKMLDAFKPKGENLVDTEEAVNRVAED
ncbi:hypothetical protein [Yoonia sp. R2-816]|uniref:hypothetical protein n=1 Tax=Yoonia sp. R2-816 TaxID=3342638 RepID=UPI003727FA41